MTDSSFTFLRVRGIEIGAHWSWVFVFGLVVWSLGSALFPAAYPGLSDTAYIAMGIVAGVLFFVSILLHELGHAFRALKEGMAIDGITLWLFGGVARFKGMFKSAGAEFRIAIAGPAVSVAITLFFLVLTWVGSGIGWPDEIQGVVDYLWRINAIVVAFNMVPALPLDGGRILRAWLWHRQQSFPQATVSAARAGKLFGGVLAAVGVLNFFSGGGGAGGLWFVFLGWFLIQAAEAEASLGLMQKALRGRRVRDLMTPDPESVGADTTIDDFLDRAFQRKGPSTYPVLSNGDLVGLISLRGAGEITSDRRPVTPVTEAMVPRAEVTVLDPDADVMDVLDSLQSGSRRAPVMEDGELIGILSVSDVVRVLEIEEIRGKEKTDGRRRRTSVLVWAIVGGLMLAAAGYLYHPPYMVMNPGETLDVSEDIAIEGRNVDDIDGRYLLTSVSVSRPNGWGLVWAALRDREIISASGFLPEDVDRDAYFRQQRELFRQSRVVAAAAAATVVGERSSVKGTGAIVEQVLPGSPAEGELRSGDVIVAVDGRQVRLATDLPQYIRSRPAGTRFRFTVERNARRQSIQLRSEPLPEVSDAPVGIGVQISTRDFEIDLPFEVDFESRSIGGPSAGLVYGLAIADLLDPEDPLGGRVVAATGTLDVEGSVGAVSGVDLKAEAAADAGATLFLVPEGDVDSVREEGLRTLGVSSLEEALQLLSSTS